MIESPDACAGTPGRFEAVDAGDAWRFRGDLTFDDAASVLDAVAALPWPASGRIDFSGLAAADSTALAVMVALRRRAHGEGRALAFDGVPARLAALAQVYGIGEAIGLPAPAP